MTSQGRGAATGYDYAVALPASGDSEELAKENTKSAASLKGEQQRQLGWREAREGGGGGAVLGRMLGGMHAPSPEAAIDSASRQQDEQQLLCICLWRISGAMLLCLTLQHSRGSTSCSY